MLLWAFASQAILPLGACGLDTYSSSRLDDEGNPVVTPFQPSVLRRGRHLLSAGVLGVMPVYR